MDDASPAARAPSPEAATFYGEASSTRRPPWARLELDGWRRDAESGLRLRLDIERRAVAAENARRDREGADTVSLGLTLIVVGVLGVAGGLITLVASFATAVSGAIHGSGTGGASGAAIAGSALAGVGAIALLSGSIVFSRRPAHLEPGEVRLALGPGSLAISGSF